MDSFSKRDALFYEWDGANDTVCMLKIDPTWENIYLSYAWRGGDIIINEMDEIASKIIANNEETILLEGDTDGL